MAHDNYGRHYVYKNGQRYYSGGTITSLIGDAILRYLSNKKESNRPLHPHEKSEKKLHRGMRGTIGMNTPYKKRRKIPELKIQEMDTSMDDVELVYEEEYIEEAKEVSEVGDKGKPNRAKKVKVASTGGQDEWAGNTEREKKIIDQYRRNTVEFPDVAGNGDDVYSGARQKRVDYPVTPGQDVKNYKDWLNAGLPVRGISYQSSTVKESYYSEVVPVATGNSEYREKGPSFPISHRDLRKNWTTVHIAPIGSQVSRDGNDTIVYHPDGSTHHIVDGELLIPKSKSKSEKGKYNVVLSSYANGVSNVGYIADKNSLSGGFQTTRDELKAKDFVSNEHAQNFINYNKPFLASDNYMSMYEKRPIAKVKADMANQKKFGAEWNTAQKEALEKGLDPDSSAKVRVARQKYRKSLPPAIAYY